MEADGDAERQAEIDALPDDTPFAAAFKAAAQQQEDDWLRLRESPFHKAMMAGWAEAQAEYERTDPAWIRAREGDGSGVHDMREGQPEAT